MKCTNGKAIGAWTLLALMLGVMLVPAAAVLAQDADTGADTTVVAPTDETVAPKPNERPDIPIAWYIAPLSAVVALFFAKKFYAEVKAADPGDPDMIEIANHVSAGAMAYLKRQYKVVTVVFIVLAGVLAFMAYVLKVQNGIVPFAFLTGGFFSGLCGYLGMKTATLASNRTTAGARNTLNQGLQVAFRAGAVMGMVVVGFGLIDITAWFLGLYFFTELHLSTITVVMLTFGMGASTQALFARVGGGIYTKAADVGADLVGKVEAGIPEDDARNPATIADNVGDNVGDVAGMGADLYESYCGSILATAALGVAAAAALFGSELTIDGGNAAIRFLAAPMLLAGVGIILSVIGIYMVQTEEKATMAVLMKALNKGVYGSSVLIAVGAFVVCWLMLGGITTPDGYSVNWLGIWGSIMAGLFGGLIIGYSTEFYTSYDYMPTKKISAQAITGPATVIISGIAEGMKSTWASLTTIIIAILLAFTLAGGGHEFMLGLYGIGFAAVGMLATLGITLATDAYGPIADNAGGNAEMTGQDPMVRERTDALDALGNTTAATGKGFAIGSAALTAMALLAAYVEEVRFGQLFEARDQVQYVDEWSEATPDEATFLGYGKFASWVDGEDATKLGTEDVEAYMLLSNQHADDDLKKGAVITFDEGSKATPENDFIRTATVTTGEGEKAKTTQLEMVLTKRASLANYMAFYDVTLMNPKVLCGMFSGVLLAFLFCAMTMEAVGRAAGAMMIECRRQFEKIRQFLRNEGKDEAFVQNPDNWPKSVTFEGEQYPNYADCVSISTAGAQKEMILPSLLAIAIPIIVGLLFGVAGVMGLLAGGLTSGFALAIFMANAGGAWDNAKKLIETFGKITAKMMKEDPEAQAKVPSWIRDDIMARAETAIMQGNPDEIVYGKGSEDHKATVVGDTVGDPFKDTSGPSLNILIKLMSMVSVVFAGLIVKFAPVIGTMLGLGN